MIEYIYFVKCPDCEDEHFDFFNDAKDFAMSCISKKPVITQLEVNRNDFGECTEHNDLGTVWSWEDTMSDIPQDTVFSKAETFGCKCGGNCKCEPGTCKCQDHEFEDDDFFAMNEDFPLDEELVEEFDRVKAACQCSRNCYDFYEAIASGKPQKEINKHGKKAYKYVKDQFGLVDDAAEDLLWSGYTVWRRLHWNNKTEALDETLKISFNNKADQQEFSKLCKETGMNTPADLSRFMKEYEADDSNLLSKLRDYKAEIDRVDTDFPVKESRKPIPEGMSIKDLVEAMEENEDTVECVGCEELFPKDECTYKDSIGYLCYNCEDRIVKCSWCDDLYDKSECRKEVDLGWLCSRCEMAIKSRGETLTFREGSYWDFLDEAVAVKDSAVIGKHVRLVENGVDMPLTTLKRILKINREYALPIHKINLIVTFDNDCIIRQETDRGYLITIPCYYRNQADRSKVLEHPEYHLCWISKNYCEFIESHDLGNEDDDRYSEDDIAFFNQEF